MKKPGKSAPAVPLLTEVAAMAAGGRETYMAWRRSPDPLLAERGQDVSIYRDLWRDAQILTAWQQRVRAVISVEWEVEPGGDRPIDRAAADDLAAQLRDIRFDAISAKMLTGLFYGYAVGECLWRLDGGRVVLADIRVRKPERFLFDRDHRLRLKTVGNFDGEPLPDRKLWLFTADGDNDDDPHGTGLGYTLYWLEYFSRNGLRFWALALDKWGQPTAKGEYPTGFTQAQIDDLVSVLTRIHSNSAVAVPEGAKVELLEAVRSSGGNFDSFMSYLDGAKTKVILSQTMTTDAGASLSQAQVHQDVKREIVRGDADLLSESFNSQVARWLTDWNFPGAAYPRVWRRLEEPDDLDARASREKVIAEMTGLRPTLSHVVDTYGGDWEPRADAMPPDAGGDDDAVFADSMGAGDVIEQLIADLAASGDIETVFEPILDPVVRLAAASESYDDLRGRLAGALAGMDATRLADLLARATFAARSAGDVED